MAFDYNEKELYGRALFSFNKEGQTITVAFEFSEEKTYMMIIFCEDGGIVNPHDPEFIDTLTQIMLKFDNGNNFDYEIFAF